MQTTLHSMQTIIIYIIKYSNNCNKEKIKNKKESFLNGSNEVFSLL